MRTRRGKKKVIINHRRMGGRGLCFFDRCTAFGIFFIRGRGPQDFARIFSSRVELI